MDRENRITCKYKNLLLSAKHLLASPRYRHPPHHRDRRQLQTHLQSTSSTRRCRPARCHCRLRRRLHHRPRRHRLVDLREESLLFKPLTQDDGQFPGRSLQSPLDHVPRSLKTVEGLRKLRLPHDVLDCVGVEIAILRDQIRGLI